MNDTSTRKHQPSLTDVAQRADVSVSTASRALLGQTGVSLLTKRRVVAAAHALGYIKDVRAQALRSLPSPTIGLHVRSVRLSHYGELIAALQSGFADHGFALTVAAAWDDADDGAAAFRALAGTRPMGLIVASGRLPVSVVEHHSRILPVVMIGQGVDSRSLGVVSDDEVGIESLAQLLYDRGHRAVGVFALDETHSRSLTARAQRIRHTLAMRGMARVEIAMHAGSDVPIDRSLREAARTATAIMCPSDAMLVAAWESLAATGVRVPEDVSLTGYDGVGQLTSPVLGITSWRQPTETIAQAVVTQMVDRIHQGVDSRHERFRGTLVPGRTVAAARATRPAVARVAG